MPGGSLGVIAGAHDRGPADRAGVVAFDERAAAPHGLVLQAEQVPRLVGDGLGQIARVAVAQRILEHEGHVGHRVGEAADIGHAAGRASRTSRTSCRRSPRRATPVGLAAGIDRRDVDIERSVVSATRVQKFHESTQFAARQRAALPSWSNAGVSTFEKLPQLDCTWPLKSRKSLAADPGFLESGGKPDRGIADVVGVAASYDEGNLVQAHARANRAVARAGVRAKWWIALKQRSGEECAGFERLQSQRAACGTGANGLPGRHRAGAMRTSVAHGTSPSVGKRAVTRRPLAAQWAYISCRRT